MRLCFLCLALLGLPATGCFAPDINVKDCAISCNGDCPPGLECSAGYCVHPGSTAVCSQGGAGGEGGEPSGSGGRLLGPTGGAGGATGGTSSGGTGNVPVDQAGAGAGGEPNNGDVLVVTTLGPKNFCSGQPATVQLRVSGGVAPYAWQLLGDSTGFSLSSDQGADTELTFQPDAAGNPSLDVQVQDAASHTTTETLPFDVFETPEILVQDLPLACTGEAYSAELTARGGDPGSYSWSVDAASSPLSVDGSTLSGTPDQTGTLEFTVSLEDAHCGPVSANVVVNVDQGGSQGCPSIGPDALPAPCADNAYSTTLTADGGTPPYTFEAVALPTGLSFDPDTQIVSGSPSAQGTLTIALADASGHQTQRSYSLKPRDKCWFAYVSSEGGASPRLNLFDPLLDARRAFPEPAAGTQSVSDFKFSPDGHFLAYRLQLASGAVVLRLLQAPTWREQALDFQGDITHYEWSPDSNVLAVAFQGQSDSFLGGVDVSLATHAAGSTSQVIPGLQILEPVSALVDSELVWFEGRSVVFHNDFIPGVLRAPSFSQLGALGFAAPTPTSDFTFYDESLQLRPAAAGFFVDETDNPDSPRLDFFPPDNLAAWTQHGRSVLAPSGLYTGRTQNGALQLFLPLAPAIDENSVPSLNAAGCSTLLAWASLASGERIACTSDATTSSKVAIFDLDTAAPVPTSTAVRGTYTYSDGPAVERRRVFSASGRWFAFTTDDRLYVADLGNGTPQVKRQDLPIVLSMAVDRPVIELGFSPDERRLIQHRAGSLSLHDLQNTLLPPYLLNSDHPLDDPAQCGEEFVTAPDHWCGNMHNPTAFVWSADSSMAAFVTHDGKLEIRHFLDVTFEAIRASESCSTECANRFEFQP